MSELNRKNNNKILIFLLIYTLLAIITTAVLIFLNKNYEINLDKNNFENNSISAPESNVLENTNTAFNLEEKDNIKSNEKNNIKKLNLKDKYSINNITITEKEIKKGPLVEDNYSTHDFNKVEISYPQIDGLNSKDVQDKINMNIKNYAEEFVDNQEIQDEDIKNIIISFIITGNFAEMISIEIVKNTYYNELSKLNNDIKYDSLNFRIDTGEKIDFSEIFTKDASIKTIVADSIYKELSFAFGLDGGENFEPDMDKIDYGHIEEETYKVMQKFNAQKEKKFYFSERTIYIIIDNVVYNIKSEDYYEYINLFNIVDSDITNLYKNGNNPKVNYVLGMPYMKDLEYKDKVTDNTYLTIFNCYRNSYTNSPDDIDKYVIEFQNVINDNLDKILSAIKNDNNNEKDKAYIYNINSYYDYENKTFFEGEKIEVKLSNFDNEIENLYGEACRAEPAGEYKLYLTLRYNSLNRKKYNLEIVDTHNDNEFELKQRYTEW